VSVISIVNLTFGYEGSPENIFEHVSFQVDTAWKLGFIGRNGRGKTTFLNLLLGKFEYTGTITAYVDFAYFPFTVEDTSLATLAVIESTGADFKLWQLERELSLLEVAADVLARPFATLSNGEQTKVLLAALFLKDNRFLLIDEPTNHLDRHGRTVVSEYLSSKQGFILVSHDRAFLDGCIDHVLSINKANIEIQRGNFSSWLLNKERQDQFELAAHAQLQAEAGRLKKAARQTADWSDQVEKTKFGTTNSGSKPDRGYIGHKAAKMMKRAKVIESRRQTAIEENAKLLKNIERAGPLKLSPLVYHANRLLTLDQVALYYGGKPICQAVSLVVERGDRIALCGKNGSGKSSLIKLICGENIQYTGQLYRGSQLIISYVPQDTSHLAGNLSDYARQNRLDESLFKAILHKLDFTKLQFARDLRDFSGGQKKKVLLARSLCEKAHLYVWDEPLNYIDILSRMQIDDLLCEFKPTMIFVEHDSAFCDHVATKSVCL